jgi:N-carbamoylputrescine amidase
MRICLIPLRTESRQSGSNSQQFIDRLEQLREQKPDLICLPECTFTGYLYCEEDFNRFAEFIPGPTTQEMARLACSYHVSLCFGMLELTEQGVYDAAILIDPSGAIIGVHRKMVEKLPFMNGNHVTSVDTDFGKLGILICADLFDEEVIKQLDPVMWLLLVPMSRSFNGASPDSRRWVNEEREVYLEAVRKV